MSSFRGRYGNGTPENLGFARIEYLVTIHLRSSIVPNATISASELGMHSHLHQRTWIQTLEHLHYEAGVGSTVVQ